MFCGANQPLNDALKLTQIEAAAKTTELLVKKYKNLKENSLKC